MIIYKKRYFYFSVGDQELALPYCRPNHNNRTNLAIIELYRAKKVESERITYISKKVESE